jgi:TM2 domain-containing membrane protein YozV
MRILSLVAFLLVALSAAAQFKDSVAANSPAPGPKPAVATALSMLMPGAGQLYNGDKGKAALHFGLFAGSVTWAALRDIGPTNADIKPVDWLSVIAVGATYLWAVIDAGVSAGKEPSAGSPVTDAAENRHLSFAPRRNSLAISYRF